MSEDREYETEPVPGLPEHLPQGEVMLWQGAPDGRAVAWRVLHGRAIAVYFALLAVITGISAGMSGASPAASLFAGARFVVIGAVALAIVQLIGWLVGRTTLYTLTSKRLVMRFGIALPMTLNIPFSQIGAADAKLYGNGTGDIALTPAQDMPVTYFHLWPHGRGVFSRRPKPTLRAVPEAREVSAGLVKAIVAAGIRGEVHSLETTEVLQPAGIPSLPAAA